ncbi:plasminogen-like [Ylistrum balloti]|uniref:plasminogen-like n=1 Tax=Ylistrum balloti TaxID=509963 RepID=UPI002905E586|nr:plasminogen-like [Ylistrum balloti]
MEVKEKSQPSRNCQLLPVPQGHFLEYPYYGSSARGRYRCKDIIDQQPVTSCPLVLCNDSQNLTATPASCSVKDVFNNSLDDYVGGVSCTVRGVPCQRWDSDTPHVPHFYRGRSDLGNRCKLYSEQRPWCYTTDPKMRWDYCPVEDIDCGTPPTILTPPTMTGTGIYTERPYRGSIALAWYRCASLVTAEPLQHCPLTRCDGDLTWSQANISCSCNDCYDVKDQIYHGRVSCTQTDIACQRWDSQTPHHHSILKGRSDLENWCQLADGEARPWCYTVSSYKRWDYCPVVECS